MGAWEKKTTALTQAKSMKFKSQCLNKGTHRHCSSPCCLWLFASYSSPAEETNGTIWPIRPEKLVTSPGQSADSSWRRHSHAPHLCSRHSSTSHLTGRNFSKALRHCPRLIEVVEVGCTLRSLNLTVSISPTFLFFLDRARDGQLSHSLPCVCTPGPVCPGQRSAWPL